MSPKTANTSFANRALFRNESIAIAALYLATPNWKTVQQEVITTNLLQSRTITNAQRLCRELLSRLRTLTHAELQLLVTGTPIEQGYILWVAVCRCYPLIGRFATGILRERHLSLKTDLRHQEFDVFFNKQADCHANLDDFKPATRAKRRQILFKILREAELIDSNYRIRPAILSQRLVQAISEIDNTALTWFPAFDADLKAPPQ
jgi:hypothetical protein